MEGKTFLFRSEVRSKNRAATMREGWVSIAQRSQRKQIAQFRDGRLAAWRTEHCDLTLDLRAASSKLMSHSLFRFFGLKIRLETTL